MQCEFNDDELLMLINGSHQRASTLLNLSNQMSQIGYRSESGKEPTMTDIRKIEQGSNDYFELVRKLRNIRSK